MKLVITLCFLLSFSTFASGNLELKNSNPTQTELYPGGKKKKNRKGKRANRKRRKHCKNIHRTKHAG